MKLSSNLAKKIIAEVQQVLQENVIVVGVDGIIMASTDPTRVDNFHEGAYLVVQSGKKLEIKNEDVNKLRGVKAGVSMPIKVNNDVIGVIGITGIPKEVSPHGELLRRMTELLIQENYIREQMDWRERSLESFVLDWLKMRKWSPMMKQRGEILGVKLNVNRRCILIKVEGEEVQQSVQPNLWWLMQRFLDQLKENDILVRWGSNRFVLLQEENSQGQHARTLYALQQLQKLIYKNFNFEIAVGVGDPVPSDGVYLSYEQAKSALDVAMETNSIVFESDLRFEMCLQDITEETREQFLKRTLGPLLAEEELIETLKVYIECNSSLKQSAERLHIHINTLHYRLKRIEDITSLSPKQFKDLVTLYLAVLFLDKHPNFEQVKAL